MTSRGILAPSGYGLADKPTFLRDEIDRPTDERITVKSGGEDAFMNKPKEGTDDLRICLFVISCKSLEFLLKRPLSPLPGVKVRRPEYPLAGR